MKKLRFACILVFVCVSICLFLLSLGIASVPGGGGGGNIYCKDVFPGNCTQGGCGAGAGWWAVACVIHCSDTLQITCQTSNQ